MQRAEASGIAPDLGSVTGRSQRSGLARSGLVRLDQPGAADWGSKLILRVRGRVIVIDEADLEWVDGAGNYVRFHVGADRHRVRLTLKEVERLLPPRRFVRVHRSTVVNINAVREFLRTPYGDLIAVLRCGQRLGVGRLYRSHVEATLATRL
jgi:two-component system LytT family response regulator